jgi:hypothetical protein
MSLPPYCRYWSVAVPAYLCVGFVVFLLVYSGLNFLLVPDINDPRNIRGKIHCTMNSEKISSFL